MHTAIVVTRGERENLPLLIEYLHASAEFSNVLVAVNGVGHYVPSGSLTSTRSITVRPGYSSARNDALSAAFAAGASRCFMIDDDVRFDLAPEALARWVEISAAGPVTMLTSLPVRRVAQSPSKLFLEVFTFADPPAEVQSLPATALSISRETWAEIGSFAEVLDFTGGEDSDYTHRALTRGHELHVVPGEAQEDFPRDRGTTRLLLVRAVVSGWVRYAAWNLDLLCYKRGRHLATPETILWRISLLFVSLMSAGSPKSAAQFARGIGQLLARCRLIPVAVGSNFELRRLTRNRNAG